LAAGLAPASKGKKGKARKRRKDKRGGGGRDCPLFKFWLQSGLATAALKCTCGEQIYT